MRSLTAKSNIFFRPGTGASSYLTFQRILLRLLTSLHTCNMHRRCPCGAVGWQLNLRPSEEGPSGSRAVGSLWCDLKGLLMDPTTLNKAVGQFRGLSSHFGIFLGSPKPESQLRKTPRTGIPQPIPVSLRLCRVILRWL